MKSTAKAENTTDTVKRGSDRKNGGRCMSSSPSTSYSCACASQYIYPKMSSLLTHKSVIGARYDREYWTDELLNKLYYFIPNDRYWDKFNLDDLDESIKLKKLNKSIEDCLITPKKIEYMCDEYSNLAATTETGATTATNTTGTTQALTITTENISATTSNTEYITERIKNDTEMKKKFLQCIGSYPDKKLRKHFYKLLKWKEKNVTDYDNREYFNQILENTVNKCKSNIREQKKEKRYDNKMHMKAQDLILERLDMKHIPEIELEKQKERGSYDEKYYRDTKCEDKKIRFSFKDMKDQFKHGTQSKRTNLKDKQGYIHQLDIKAQIRNAPLFERKSKSMVDKKRSDKRKSEITTKSGEITQRSAKNKKISGSKSSSSKISKSEKKLKHGGTAKKMEDLKRKINELNYMKTSKTGATCKLDPMAQFTVKDENINYLTITDGVTTLKDAEPDTFLRETVKKVITEINMVKNNEVFSDLLEGGTIVKGNFLGIKPELDQINEETKLRYDEAKKKIVTILKTLKGIRKKSQLRLESKKIDSALKIDSRKMMERLRKNKVLNWFKQKDYLKQMKIKKTEMKFLVKDDHINLLKRILSENKTIGTFLEHRWDIAAYLAENAKEGEPQEKEPSTAKSSVNEIPYESGTSDDELRPKVIADESDQESRPSKKSAKSMLTSRSSTRPSTRPSKKPTKPAAERRDTIVYEISEPDDFRDLDDWEEFMAEIRKETKEMKAADAEAKAGPTAISKEEIRYVLRPESKRTSLPDFIYDMFETGLPPDAEEVAEDMIMFKKKKVGEAVEEEEVSEECVLEKIESDYVVRKQLDKRLEQLFENFDKARKEYAKDDEEEYNYDKCAIQWQVIQRRLHQQKLFEEREARSRSFRTLPSSGSSKDDEPCYITDLKQIVGLKLKKAITDVLMVRPPEKPIEYMVGMLHHYSYDEEYEIYMNAIDRELLTIFDDLYVNRNYGPRRFKIVKDAVIDSESPYPTDSETSFDSELLQDRDVYDIIEECRKPKPYDLSFLNADVISSVSMPSSPSHISISSILSVTTGMTVGSSIASMSVAEPSDLEIYDDDDFEKGGICNAAYVVDLDNPPPLDLVDGKVIFKLEVRAKYAAPMMDLYSPPPFDMGYDDILLNNVNNVDEPIDLGLDELLKIEEERKCPLCLPVFGIPCGLNPNYPRGYAMDPDDLPPFNMGYDDILINEVNNEEEPIDIDLDEILRTAEMELRGEDEAETNKPQISLDDISQTG